MIGWVKQSLAGIIQKIKIIKGSSEFKKYVWGKGVIVLNIGSSTCYN